MATYSGNSTLTLSGTAFTAFSGVANGSYSVPNTPAGAFYAIVRLQFSPGFAYIMDVFINGQKINHVSSSGDYDSGQLQLFAGDTISFSSNVNMTGCLSGVVFRKTP